MLGMCAARQVGDAGNDLAAARQFAEPRPAPRQDGAEEHAQPRPEQALLDRIAHEENAAERERKPADPDHPLGAEAFLQIGQTRAGFRRWRRRLERRRWRLGRRHWRLGGQTGIGRTWQNDRNRHRARRWFRRRRNRLGNGRRLWLGRADRRTDDLGLNFGRPRGGIGGRRCRTKRCRFDPCRQLHEIVFEALERTIELLELLAQPADLVQHEDQQDDAAENKQEFHGRPRRIYAS